MRSDMKVHRLENEASQYSTCANQLSQYEKLDVSATDSAVGSRNSLIVSAQE